MSSVLAAAGAPESPDPPLSATIATAPISATAPMPARTSGIFDFALPGLTDCAGRDVIASICCDASAPARIACPRSRKRSFTSPSSIRSPPSSRARRRSWPLTFTPFELPRSSISNRPPLSVRISACTRLTEGWLIDTAQSISRPIV